ncbi:MAG: RluA family pseudouridine synthase [Planctomycetes bacterium]|nr:RluA family pseudouridine synthase [Planctomycetota bacterium]
MAESDGNPERITVREREAGLRIEKLLSKHWPDRHWSYVQKVLRQSRVVCDGIPLQRGQAVWAGQRLEVLPAPSAAAPLPNRKLHVEVLHEDEHLAVVFKPCGRAVHPGPGHGSDTLLNGLIARFPELLELGEERSYGLVHRLDLETSGPLAVARTVAGYDGLIAAFRERRVEKRYWALVEGRLPGEGTVTTPVGGKDAETRYRVLERAGSCATVEAHPITGRTHQLRIHFAELGAPVLGDARHGAGLDDTTKRLGVSRLALHCERLAFAHPLSGEAIEVLRPVPKLLRRAWARAQASQGS